MCYCNFLFKLEVDIKGQMLFYSNIVDLLINGCTNNFPQLKLWVRKVSSILKRDIFRALSSAVKFLFEKNTYKKNSVCAVLLSQIMGFWVGERREFIFVLRWLISVLSFKSLCIPRRPYLSQACIYEQQSYQISHWKWGTICLCTSIFNYNYVCEQRRKLIAVLTKIFFTAVGYRELQLKGIKNLQVSATATSLSLSQSLYREF